MNPSPTAFTSVLNRAENAASVLEKIAQDESIPAPARVSAARYILDYSFKAIFGEIPQGATEEIKVTIVDDL
jgi:hypothetical protein